ncbi:hypothetical protein GUITHDRAFT_149970 [Guillardia theta CCMP2712]|uniref:Fe2OG dioxygenase domain-containing protein n=2 Tax=Guillardia theta TaxID=55529 RepID=L1K1J2_GUITC|nr:hypothetical protein GUITHDRAFT_149970 [Guillardia theta CCMP2712]EKX54295.1 hypothetical protein GUITHDRAFT_149970 [Guillardia theta CCMP2712]|eukprot:XP_005841275.1 hypothetical protein GUITHDRAFT_149970 [Guillardia theta CCMP2712]
MARGGQAIRSLMASSGARWWKDKNTLMKRKMSSLEEGESVEQVFGKDFKPFGDVLVHPNENGENCFITYLPKFMQPRAATELFEHLRDNVEWRREEDSVGVQERLTAYFGDPHCTFAYVGLRLTPQPWTGSLLPIKNHVNSFFTSHGLPPLTACLLNNYEQGAGRIVWHHDEVRAHGSCPLVVSITLSPDGNRLFEFRHVASKRQVSLPVLHGSAVVMAGRTQLHWQHRLPCTPSPHRISLTFRSIVPGYEEGLLGSLKGMDDCQ